MLDNMGIEVNTGGAALLIAHLRSSALRGHPLRRHEELAHGFKTRVRGRPVSNLPERGKRDFAFGSEALKLGVR